MEKEKKVACSHSNCCRAAKLCKGVDYDGPCHSASGIVATGGQPVQIDQKLASSGGVKLFTNTFRVLSTSLEHDILEYERKMRKFASKTRFAGSQKSPNPGARTKVLETGLPPASIRGNGKGAIKPEGKSKPMLKSSTVTKQEQEIIVGIGPFKRTTDILSSTIE